MSESDMNVLGDDYWRICPIHTNKSGSGIKTKSKKGSIGDTWCRNAGCLCLSLSDGATGLNVEEDTQGRQVLDFKLAPGKVTAQVQVLCPSHIL